MESYSSYNPFLFLQDAGHTGIIHDVPWGESDPHLGIILFDLGEEHPAFGHYTLSLYPLMTEYLFPDDREIFEIIPGVSTDPYRIFMAPVLTCADLMESGWIPFHDAGGGVYGIGTGTKVYSSEIVRDQWVDWDFAFNLPDDTRYLIFCIMPVVSDIHHSNLGYQVQFAGVNSMFREYYPMLTAYHLISEITLNDVVESHETRPTQSWFDFRYEFGTPLERAYVITQKDFYDSVEVIEERVAHIETRGFDALKNKSMIIHHIAVSEHGKVKEIYGFNGYTERCVYPDWARGWEVSKIQKFNFISWSGVPMEYPYLSMLWYGEIVLFYSLEEFNQCCHEFFVEHGKDKCPVCGNNIEEHLKYSYIDVTRIPHQIYVCSLECLHKYSARLLYYRNWLTKPNNSYFD